MMKASINGSPLPDKLCFLTHESFRQCKTSVERVLQAGRGFGQVAASQRSGSSSWRAEERGAARNGARPPCGIADGARRWTPPAAALPFWSRAQRSSLEQAEESFKNSVTYSRVRSGSERSRALTCGTGRAMRTNRQREMMQTAPRALQKSLLCQSKAAV